MMTREGFARASRVALLVVVTVLVGARADRSRASMPELCNGLDDDGDAQIDEGFAVGAACSVGRGACSTAGIQKCTADGLGTECCVDDGNPDGACGPLESAPIDLLSNGGFEADVDSNAIPDDWTGLALSGDSRKCDRPAQIFAHAGSCAFRFEGESAAASASLRQIRTGLAGKACDQLTVRAWALGKNVPTDATARVRVQLRSAGVLVKAFALKLAHGTFAYDRFRKIVNAPLPYDEVRAWVEYGGASGQLVVDDVSLTKTSIEDPGPGPTQQCAFTPDASGFFQLTSPQSDYWVRLPATYDVLHPRPTRLFVGLHGCGDTAYNFATWAVVPFVLRTTQDYIGVSLGGRDGQCWTIGDVDRTKVAAAIAHVRSCFYVHQQEVVVGGYSSGGELAYDVGLRNAAAYAGILIENAGLSQAVGGANVDAVLQAAAWRINVAHSARLSDGSFPIAGVRSDRDAMLTADIPLVYRELAGDHDGTTEDWAEFLLPAMATWVAP